MFQTAISDYLTTHEFTSLNLRSVLFDMDGVLFDSMPNHAEAWHRATRQSDLCFSREEAYLHEGRTGAGTIHIIYRREKGREATPEEIETIYRNKSTVFNKFPEAARMSGALELLKKVKQDGLFPMIVTGSGQKSLLKRLETNFPGLFTPELMVTAFDVKHGKPNPEPYLMALEKGKLNANECIVVENAPLGIRAAVAAGIFTVAVNTGPLDDQILLDGGADLLFPSMEALDRQWEELLKALKRTRNMLAKG